MREKVKWLLVSSILVGLVSEGFSLTLSDLLARTRVYLRDTSADTSLQKFSDTQLTRFINDGQQETNLLTWAVIGSTKVTLTSGTTEYSLPTDFILPLRVTFNNTPIVERTFSFLDQSRTDWVTNTGTPQSYYVRVDSSLVAGVSRESIGFIPISTFTAVVDIQYLGEPSSLSAGSDVPFGPDNSRTSSFHQVLCYYAAYRGYLAMGLPDFAGIYLLDYNKIVALMESSLKSRLMFNPSFRGRVPVTTQGAQQ